MLVMAVLGLLATVAAFYFSRYDSINRENLSALIGQAGPWAVLSYAALYIVASPVPFVAPMLSATSGYLFGPLAGTVYTIFIATLSAFVPFALARRLGKDRVEARLQGHRWKELYDKSADSHGFWFVVVLRLAALIPWEVQNYVAGLTKVPPLTFAAGTLLGTIPGTFALVFLGSSARDPGSWLFYAAIILNLDFIVVPAVLLMIHRAKARRESKAERNATEKRGK